MEKTERDEKSEELKLEARRLTKTLTTKEKALSSLELRLYAAESEVNLMSRALDESERELEEAVKCADEITLVSAADVDKRAKMLEEARG